jgi:DNA-binding transcriptional regulator YbjK
VVAGTVVTVSEVNGVPDMVVDGPVDGRRARGQARSQVITEATLAVVSEQGLAGLTHRAVAARAGVSLASTTYHFPTVNDLVRAALNEASRRVLADQRDLHVGINQQGQDPAEACADLILHQIGPQRSVTLVQLEMLLLAVRTPELRPVVQAWRHGLIDLLEPLFGDRVVAQAVAVTMRGLAADSLMADPPPTRTELMSLIRTALHLRGGRR